MSSFVCCDGDISDGTSTNRLINPNASISFLMQSAATHLECVCFPAAPIIQASDCFQCTQIQWVRFFTDDIKSPTWSLKITTNGDPSCRDIMRGSSVQLRQPSRVKSCFNGSHHRLGASISPQQDFVNTAACSWEGSVKMASSATGSATNSTF